MDENDLQQFIKFYKQYMSDLNVTPTKAKTKHETAWDLAYKRYRQAKNNELALSMAPSAIRVEKDNKTRIPPRPNLKWKKKTKRWASGPQNPLKALYSWKKKIDAAKREAQKEKNYNLYSKLLEREGKISDQLDEVIDTLQKQSSTTPTLPKMPRINKVTPLKPIKRAPQQKASTTVSTPDGGTKEIKAKSNLNLYKPFKPMTFKPGQQGLVEREITVRRKDGTTYKRKQKVKA